MYCPYCGSGIPDDASFCSKCGRAVTAPQPNETATSPQSINAAEPIISQTVKCPHCGGRRLQVMTEQSTNVQSSGSGYSVGKGCCGWFLLGPFGLLCGLCGNSAKTSVSSSSKTYWICSNCGHKFRNLEEWKRELDAHETALRITVSQVSAGILLLILCIVTAGIGFMILADSEQVLLGLSVSAVGVFALVFVLAYFMSIFEGRKTLERERQAYTELARESFVHDENI